MNLDRGADLGRSRLFYDKKLPNAAIDRHHLYGVANWSQFALFQRKVSKKSNFFQN